MYWNYKCDEFVITKKLYINIKYEEKKDKKKP